MIGRLAGGDDGFSAEWNHGPLGAAAERRAMDHRLRTGLHLTPLVVQAESPPGD
jgi:hypothetical protein